MISSQSTGSNTIEPAAPRLDENPTADQQGTWLFSIIACAPSDPPADTDTDSIGRQTPGEFADAQEEPRDDGRPHEEGEESNSNTGEYLFSTSFPLTLSQTLDQSNELIPDQFDDFNWDEDFGVDFDDGEFGELDQSNVETKWVGSQEPISGRSSKRGFDEIDSDTAGEEETLGDASPSKFISTPCVFVETHVVPLRFKTEEGAVV